MVLECIQKITESIELVLKDGMLDKQCINNEQVALAIVYKKNKKWFNLVNDSQIRHLELVLLLQ